MTTELKRRLSSKDLSSIERDCLEIEQLSARLSEERRAEFKARTDNILRVVKRARQRQILRGYCILADSDRQTFLAVYHEKKDSRHPISFSLRSGWAGAAYEWKTTEDKLRAKFAALPRNSATVVEDRSQYCYLPYLKIPKPTLTLMPKGFRLSSKQFTAAVNAGKLSLEEFINWDPSLDDETDTKE